MKKETFNEDLEVIVTSKEETAGHDDNATDPNANGKASKNGDDESGRPNRGAGSAGPKNPIGGGNRDQYSLRNEDDE